MLAAALALQLTTVLVFTTTDCPISNRYAPEIQRLATKFATHVRFVFVYPVPSDSEATIREHRKKFGGGEWRRDPSQKLVKLTGVTVTPEVAVIDPRDLVVYRGRLDDRYVALGKDRIIPTTHELEDVLKQAVTGNPITPRQTVPVGCYLSDLLK